MKKYTDMALNMGFTAAEPIDGSSITCNEDIRALCNPRQCPKHGTNWVCPPGSGTLEECKKRVASHKKGLLLQSVTEIDVKNNLDKLEGLSREHNKRVYRLADALRVEIPHTLPLSTGGCIICEKCAFPEECRNPERRMHSLSAHGIDVGKLCEAAHLPYSFAEDRVSFVACLLI